MYNVIMFAYCLFTGILFALTAIGPAFGYLMSSGMLRFYVDFNTVSSGKVHFYTQDIYPIFRNIADI